MHACPIAVGKQLKTSTYVGPTPLFGDSYNLLGTVLLTHPGTLFLELVMEHASSYLVHPTLLFGDSYNPLGS